MPIYIDPSRATNGTGTFADPRNTWAGVTWTAGETYLQREGTTFPETVTVGVSGTSGAPVRFGCYDASGAEVSPGAGQWTIDGENIRTFGLDTNSRDWLYVSNLRATRCTNGVQVRGAQQTFEHVRSNGNSQFGFGLVGSVATNDLTMRNVEASGNANAGAALQHTTASVTRSRWLFEDCRFQNNGSHGILMSASAETTGSVIEDITFRRVQCMGNAGDGLLASFASTLRRVTAEACDFSGNTGTGFFVLLTGTLPALAEDITLQNSTTNANGAAGVRFNAAENSTGAIGRRITLRNLVSTGNFRSNVSVYYKTSKLPVDRGWEHVVIERVKANDSADEAGISLHGATGPARIFWCEAYRNNFLGGIHVGNCGFVSVRHNKAGWNQNRGNTQGIGVDGQGLAVDDSSNDCDISYNYSHDHVGTSNTNTGQGIYVFMSERVKVVGNVCERNKWNLMVGDSASADVTLDNNTLIAPSSAHLRLTDLSNGAVTLRNNLYVGGPYAYSVNPSRTIATSKNAFPAGGLPSLVGGVETTFVAWTATRDQDALTADPLITPDGKPLPGSPLLTSGADLGYVRDIRGLQSRRHIGAYGKATTRRIA